MHDVTIVPTRRRHQRCAAGGPEPLRPGQQRPDHRDERGDLDTNKPGEMATHLLVQGVAGQVDLRIHHVEPPLDAVQPALDAVQPRVDSPLQAVDSAFETGKPRVGPPFQADKRVADTVDVARMFFDPSGFSRTVRWDDRSGSPKRAGRTGTPAFQPATRLPCFERRPGQRENGQPHERPNTTLRR